MKWKLYNIKTLIGESPLSLYVSSSRMPGNIHILLVLPPTLCWVRDSSIVWVWLSLSPGAGIALPWWSGPQKVWLQVWLCYWITGSFLTYEHVSIFIYSKFFFPEISWKLHNIWSPDHLTSLRTSLTVAWVSCHCGKCMEQHRIKLYALTYLRITSSIKYLPLML